MARIRMLRHRAWLLATLLAVSLRAWPLRALPRSGERAARASGAGRLAASASFPFLVRLPGPAPRGAGPALDPAGFASALPGVVAEGTALALPHRTTTLTCKNTGTGSIVLAAPPPATNMSDCLIEHTPCTSVTHQITYHPVAYTYTVGAPMCTTGYGFVQPTTFVGTGGCAPGPITL